MILFTLWVMCHPLVPWARHPRRTFFLAMPGQQQPLSPSCKWCYLPVLSTPLHSTPLHLIAGLSGILWSSSTSIPCQLRHVLSHATPALRLLPPAEPATHFQPLSDKLHFSSLGQQCPFPLQGLLKSCSTSSPGANASIWKFVTFPPASSPFRSQVTEHCSVCLTPPMGHMLFWSCRSLKLQKLNSRVHK